VNVSKSPLRRASALVAGSLIGLAGVAVFATPALAHHSTVSGSATCDTESGKWVVDWTVNAIGDGSPGQTFQFTQVDLTPAGTTLDNPVIAANAAAQPAGVPITAKQLVPGDATSSSLTIASRWSNNFADRKPASFTVEFGEECKKTPNEEPSTPSEEPSTPSEEPSTPSEEPSTPPVEIPEEVPAEPILDITCDTISIGVDNTKNDTPFTIEYKTSKGEERTLVVKPGESKSEMFSATEGFFVEVTFTVEYEGKTYSSSGTIPWEQPAEGCDDGEGGGLPVTGAAAGGVAAGAAGLLVIGGALFFAARRRKVKFTA
jgi:LPXTG-motif cell wall-anchored protein